MAPARRAGLERFPLHPKRAELHAESADDAAGHAGRQRAGEAAQLSGQYHEGLCRAGAGERYDA